MTVSHNLTGTALSSIKTRTLDGPELLVFTHPYLVHLTPFHPVTFSPFPLSNERERELKKQCSEHRWNYLACTIEGIQVKRLQGGV